MRSNPRTDKSDLKALPLNNTPPNNYANKKDRNIQGSSPEI